jgi:hypothetical protein
MRTKVIAALAMAVAAAVAFPAEGQFVLAGGGKRTVIIRGAEQPAYEFPYWGGHQILQRYLKLITGVDVAVVTDADVAGKDLDALYDFRIWVGDQPRVQQVVGTTLQGMDDDGFVIRVVGRDLYLSGKKKWGSHWAPYELLERYAGCRWYMESGLKWWEPQNGMIGIGDIIPKASKVEIPSTTNLVVEPSYRGRWFMEVPKHAFREREADRFHHNLFKIIQPSVYGTSNPEYFPLIGGKRYVPPADRPYDFQPCTANSDVVRIVADAAIAHFDAKPDERSFSVGMNDSQKYCECAGCRGAAPSYVTGTTERIAWTFFDFYNKVAARVKVKHPDKRLGCLAYGVLSQLPSGSITIDPMIVPYLTIDSAQLFDAVQVKEFDETVKRWRAMVYRMGIYEYIFGEGFIIPRIYSRYLIPNIQAHYGVGVDGFRGEAWPNWGLDGPKYWLIDKMLWNAKADPQVLLDDYYRNMFGPVADVMRDYFEYLEEVWATQTLKSDKSNFRWYRSDAQLAIFSPEKCDHGWALLEQARGEIERGIASAGTAAQKESLQAILTRIDFFQTTFALPRTLSVRNQAAVKLGELAATKPIPLTANQWLESWLTAPDPKPAYDRVAALKFAISKLPAYDTVKQWYGSNPGVMVGMRGLVERAMGQVQAKGSVNTLVELHGRIDETDVHLRAKAEAKGSGSVFGQKVTTAPVIDGVINGSEWPAKIFDGQFYRVYSMEERAPGRTVVYAASTADTLYLAFDSHGDTSVMGGSVTGVDTDPGAYPKMVADDAIALTLTRDGTKYQVIRVNINGSVQDFEGTTTDIDVTTAKVRKTSTGWQAELAIKLAGTLIDPKLVAAGPTWVSVARYSRERAPDGTVKAYANTMMPTPLMTGAIGTGNHANCMVFVYGSRIVYGGQATSTPAEPTTVTLTMARTPSAGGVTTPVTGSHSYQQGQVVAISAAAAAGYQFVRWDGPVASSTSASTSVTMTSSTTVTAVFETTSTTTTRSLTVGASPANGGSTTPSGTSSHADGSVVTVTAAPAAGYRFTGWQGKVADQSASTTTVTMTTDLSIAAVFEKTTVDPTCTVEVKNESVTTSKLVQSCGLISTGPSLVVRATGRLELRAGSAVALRNGTAVLPGGSFVVKIDPALLR